MGSRFLMQSKCVLMLSVILVLVCLLVNGAAAKEPEWNPVAIKVCDRACLVGIMDGYQTVNNPPPGGRMMPAPFIPTADTERGREMLAFSMLTCSEQIDTKTFAYMKRIRPRRVLVIDEQKQTVATFPLFVHDGTSRNPKPGAPPGMILNLVTMETFGIRNDLIHHVEAFPFVTLPYGLGNGWTIGSGR